MYAIQNYTNTKCELEMSKQRLTLLLEKKSNLWNRYFSSTSKLSDIKNIQNTNNSKMADYLYELNNVDIGTGKSLAEELEYEKRIIKHLKKTLKLMDKILSHMTGIEHELFYEIVYNGTNITKAVEKISNKYEIDTQTVWKNYYKRIKGDIKKILKYTVKIQ